MVDPATAAAGTGGDDGDGGARPQFLGPYRVLERLGAGGMGEVFLAERREPVPQRVALKVIRADRLDRTYRARFQMEQSALARMDHPNIARLFDAGQDGEQAWFAMEYVPGLPLGDYCRKHRLSLEQRLHLFLQLCDGVQHAHMKGILHRDLKPGNILVREVDGRPVAKIIDFGLAQPVDPLQIRATLHEGMRQIVGTFAYMSPEQAQRTEGDLDTRTDVYALGVVLFELLVGELPIDLDEVQKLGAAWFGAFLQGHEPPKPSTKLSQLGERLSTTAAERGVTPQRLQAFVRGELDWVTTKAMARDRQQRYPSVRDFGRDLERFLRHEPVEAGPPTAWYRGKKWLQRHARAVAAAAGVVVVGVAFAAVVERSAGQVRAAESARQSLGQALRAVRLVERGRTELWPVRLAAVPAMEAWLQAAAEAGSHADELAAQVARLTAAGSGQDAAAAVLLRELQRGREALAELPPLRERVEARRRRAAELAEQTVTQVRDRWDAVLAELRADPELATAIPAAVPGLVPLGRNPRTGRFEFYLLESAGPAPLPRRRDDGDYDVDADTGIVFVLVPPGRFTVTIGTLRVERTLAPFLIARHEMTQAQWARLRAEQWRSSQELYDFVSGNDPDGLQRRAGEVGEVTPSRDVVGFDAALWVHPVQQVTWEDAMRLLPRWQLTLPTQAQWWWAANGRQESALSFAWLGAAKLGAFVNFADETRRVASWQRVQPGIASDTWDGFFHTAPVDALRANPFGLHHVFGNCAELCRDAYVEPMPVLVDGPEQGTGDAAVSGRARVLGLSFLDGWGLDRANLDRANLDRANLDRAILGHQMVVGNLHDYFGVRPVFAGR